MTTNQPTDATQYIPPLDRNGNIDFYGVDSDGVDLKRYGKPTDALPPSVRDIAGRGGR